MVPGWCKRRIGVIGSGQASARGRAVAKELGRLIAEQGAVLVCGGLGGVMEAAAQGCAEAGGEVLAVLPGDSAAQANPYVSLPVVTDMGHARNVIIAQTSEVLIAVEGEYGTLAEIAISLKLGKKVVQLLAPQSVPGSILAQTPEEAVALAVQGLEEVQVDGQK